MRTKKGGREVWEGGSKIRTILRHAIDKKLFPSSNYPSKGKKVKCELIIQKEYKNLRISS